MLLGNKKKQGEEQNWCIVLNPLRNELDKKRVARKISEVFLLSAEEATDLVSNTPIILLDNLPKLTAIKVKKYFYDAGADVVLTNDIFFKRKCYRTVWPDPPNLSFLKNSREPSAQKSRRREEELLDADDALKEIRSLKDSSGIGEVDAPAEAGSLLSHQENRKLIDELEGWRRECVSRRSEVERLQSEIERMRKEREREAGRVKSDGAKETGLDRQLQEVRQRLRSAEEKYEALKAEYRQARKVFEDKVTQSLKSRETSEARIRDLQGELDAAREKNRAFEEKMQLSGAGQDRQRDEAREKTTELMALLEQKDRQKTDLQDKLQTLENSLRQEYEKNSEAGRQFEDLKKENERLKEEAEKKRVSAHASASRAAENEMSLKEKLDLLELKLADSYKETKTLKDKWESAQRQLEAIQNQDESSKAEQDKLRVSEAELRKKYDAILSRYNSLLIEHDHDKLTLLKNEDKMRNFDAVRRSLNLELESKSRRLTEAEERTEKLQTELERLRPALETVEEERETLIKQLEEQQLESGAKEEAFRRLEDALKEKTAENESLKVSVSSLKTEKEKAEADRLHVHQDHKERLEKMNRSYQEAVHKLEAFEKQLQESEQNARKSAASCEAKDQEIEGLRIELEKVTRQAEQAEAERRRRQVAEEVAGKEEELKRLVDEQGRIEVEIRQREETMRTILSRQDALEKQILENRQAQKHLTEQEKKEKKTGAQLS